MSATSPPRQARHSVPARPARRSPAAVVLALCWAGAAAVLGLWWHDTAAVVGPADWLIGAGRIAGLLAGYCCALLVLLMARVPALEQGVGSDRVARWHAMAGRYALNGPDGRRPALTANGLRATLPDIARHDVYLCGPPGMARASYEALRAAGVPARHIHHESFEL